MLPRETLEKVLATIRKDIATGEVRVDNPTQNLESYFLDVVAKAKLAAHETSGAQSGARVAEYLRGGASAGSPTEKVLEKLSLPPASPSSAVRSAVEVAVPQADESKLAALVQPAAPAVPPEKPATKAEPAKPVDLSKADEKLSTLLGKQK